MFLAKSDKQAIGASAVLLIGIGVYLIIQYIRMN
jgi:hypothetical protein